MEFLGMIVSFETGKITKQYNKLLKMQATSIRDISTLLGVLEAETNNSHNPISLQRNWILPNRGIQDVRKLQPTLYPQSKSYPGNSLVEVKCLQGQ